LPEPVYHKAVRRAEIDDRHAEVYTNKNGDFRMDKNGNFDLSPTNSDKTDEWIINHSFTTPQEAITTYQSSLRGDSSRVQKK